ncbi:hypothetical protein L1887_25782 [Cichorium endivia]|nr:hypothetical protein L1887_25782 [Cichorium endivia]
MCLVWYLFRLLYILSNYIVVIKLYLLLLLLFQYTWNSNKYNLLTIPWLQTKPSTKEPPIHALMVNALKNENTHSRT